MTDDGLPAPPRPAYVKRLAPVLLIATSILIAILFVELACRIFVPSRYINVASNPQLIMFFDGRNSVFRNVDGIDAYEPNDEIRNVAFFYTDTQSGIEYDYRFRTNNFGLVEDADIAPDRASLLLLGDSFTEGQGAEPWFRLVSPEIERLGYQPINGGLRGTGFAHWLRLDSYLTERGFRIRKVLILFISDDYRRPMVAASPAAQQCLQSLRQCDLDRSYDYRLPPASELQAWIARIKTARSPIAEHSGIEGVAAELLPASYRVYTHFRERLRNPALHARLDEAEQASPLAIRALIQRHGRDNLIFLHLPQKDEMSGPNDLGRKARRAIEEAGGKLIDGFDLCRLGSSDYFVHDNHPNKSGYKKIADCVEHVIKDRISDD